MNIGANRNAHGKRTVSTKQPQVIERLDSWASRLWRGIELIFKSHATRPIFSTRPITRVKSFFFLCVCVCVCGGGGGGGVWGGDAQLAQLQCIYYLVLYTDLKAAEGN